MCGSAVLRFCVAHAVCFHPWTLIPQPDRKQQPPLLFPLWAKVYKFTLIYKVIKRTSSSSPCFNQPRQLRQLFYNSPSTCSCSRPPQSMCSLVSRCISHALWNLHIYVQYGRRPSPCSPKCTQAVRGGRLWACSKVITSLIHSVLTAEIGSWIEVDITSLQESKAKEIHDKSKKMLIHFAVTLL